MLVASSPSLNLIIHRLKEIGQDVPGGGGCGVEHQKLSIFAQQTKSSSKVERPGTLNFCLHAVGSFIHLCHVGAGLQNFIHLRHPAALAGYVHSSKN